MLLTPQMIESAARDIASFWESSELGDVDKSKILDMVHKFYESSDAHFHEQYLGQLTKRLMDRHSPQTEFEK